MPINKFDFQEEVTTQIDPMPKRKRNKRLIMGISAFLIVLLASCLFLSICQSCALRRKQMS